jgi:hypothetical protein
MNRPTVKAKAENGSVSEILVEGDFSPNKQKSKQKDAIEEKLPISEFYKVVDYVTIYKTNLWWEAIVIFESYGKRQIGMYLWQKRKDQWKRKNKFGIRTSDEWNNIKNAVDQLAPRFSEK